MNPEKFEEQLKKYKVIRSADYYKPRHVRSKQISQASSSGAKSGSATSKGKQNQVESSPPAEGVFGMIAEKCSKDLSSDQLAMFMQNLMAYQGSVSKRVNLNDLEALCT